MSKNLKNIYALFGYHFPLLIAFFLPFGINQSIVVMLWAICFLASGNLKKNIAAVFENKWSYVFISFFLLQVISYFFSDNKPSALHAIEIKLSFLAFPILMFSTHYDDVNIKKIVISFVSGCFLASLLCVFRAFYLYYFENINAFFYTDFSYFMHPSYFAMYLILAQLLVMLYYKNWLGHLSNLNFKIGCISLMFIISIFLCSSKMGLITAILFLPITLFTSLYKSGYKKTIAVICALFLLVFGTAYNVFPKPFERIKMALTVSSHAQNIDKSATESTAVRILIWKESVKLIQQNPILGVTPGDVNDVLCKTYKENGLTGALNKQLNAHNQFLQTLLDSGIIGLMFLLAFTLGALIYGLTKRNLPLVLFSGIIMLNFLVESMLQAQAGFVFFVFFVCLFLHYNLSGFSKTP